MKLHVPSALRLAILAACTFPLSSTAWAYSAVSDEGYTLVHQSGSKHGFEQRSIWKDYTAKKYTFSVNGTTKTVESEFLAPKYVHMFQVSGSCSGSSSCTTGKFTSFLDVEQQGGGANWSYNCSERDAKGNLTRAGVWYLATNGNNTKNVQLSNYNAINISDCRQQYTIATPTDVVYAPLTGLYNVVYSYAHTDFASSAPSRDLNAPALRTVGFNFKLTDTNSFTYQKAYTGGTGSFTSGSGLTTQFHNVKVVKFLNNTARDLGGIVFGANQKFTITNADNVLFQGNSASAGVITAGGTSYGSEKASFRVSGASNVQFKNNTGSLFRNTDVVFADIDTLRFAGNKGYVLDAYFTASMTLSGIRDILFTNNTNTTTKCCLFDGSHSGSKVSFEDCGSVRFSKLAVTDRLHGDFIALGFRNVKDLSITDNTATNGMLVGTLQEVKGIGNSFSVTGNSVKRAASGAALFSGDVYLHGGACVSDTSYTGVTPKFNIENNTAYGPIQYFTTAGNVKVDDTKSFLFRYNKILKKAQPADTVDLATCDLYYVLGKSLTLNRVTSAIVFSNTFETNYITGLLTRTLTATDFGAVTVSNNTFSGKGVLPSLFYAAVFNGRSDGTSTVTIANNKFTVTGGVSSITNVFGSNESCAATYTAKNLASFKYSNNTYTLGSATRTAGLGRPVFTDVANVEISGNKTIGGGNISSCILAGAGFSSSADTTLQKTKVLTISNNAITGVKDATLNPHVLVKEARGAGAYVNGSYFLKLLDNQTITMSGNSVRGAAKAYGGAVYTGFLSAKNNKSATFSKNSAISLADGSAAGGALYINYRAKNSDFTSNDKMVFTGNWAEAVRSQSGHQSGGVAQGGAIYMGGATHFIGAKTLTFTGNHASGAKKAQGGAIYAYSSITLKGSAVQFRGNYTASGTFTSLNATSSKGMTLMAEGASGYVRFYDSVENTGALVVNESGVACGEVLFSGQYAAADLKAIKSKYSAAELAASRSVTAHHVELNSGRLTFRQTGVSLSSSDSNCFFTAKGSRLGMESSTLDMKRNMAVNGTLAFKGKNTLSASCVTLGAGATLEFNFDSTFSSRTAKNTLNATLVQSGKLNIAVTGTGPDTKGTYALLKVSSFNDKNWTKANLTLTGTSVYDLQWKNNTLYMTCIAPHEPASTTLTSKMNGQPLLFAKSKSYTVSGTVSPGSVTVRNTSAVTWAGSGSIAGRTSVLKERAGVLNINNKNKYTGGTTLKQGTIVTRTSTALGTGAVTVNGGTLHMCSQALANTVNVDASSAVIKGGTKFSGRLTLTKGTLSGDKINIASGKNAYLKTGTVKNALGGTGHVYKQGTGTVTLAGTNNWTGNTYVQGGTLVISGATTLRGTTRTYANTTLDVRRAVTMGNLYLGGGTLALKAGNMLTVTGTLTLANATKLALSGVTASSPVLIKYGKLSNTSKKSLAQFFGLTGDFTITDASGKLSIAQAAAKKGSVVTQEDAIPVEVAAPEPSVPANALGQSTWGTARAARLFDHTVRDHAQAQSVALDKNRSVWFAGMSGFSHVDDAADTNIYGGAVGMQFNGSMGGNAGIAIGQTFGHVSPAGATRVKQQTQHAALYGTKMLYTSTTDSVSLTGTASYGTTDSDHENLDWTQHSAVLGVRGTWEHKVGKSTGVYGFAGLEYLATDSESGSGSIQALQGSIGAGISHTSGRLTLHADASFTPDMVRNAPSSTVNPGRLGFEVGAGASYRINDKWSINAGYTYHNEKRADSHEAYIGARCTF